MEPVFDIDDAFEEFMRKVYPAVKEHDLQYHESRRIFYGGVASMFFALTGKLAVLAETSEDNAEAQLHNIEHQLTDFFKKQIGFNR